MHKEKTGKPKCFTLNSDTYPLCTGAEQPVDFAENDCVHCNLYENMDEEQFK